MTYGWCDATADGPAKPLNRWRRFSNSHLSYPSMRALGLGHRDVVAASDGVSASVSKQATATSKATTHAA